MERVVSKLTTPFLEVSGAFGADQWAFRKKRSCRDLVALLVLRWLWALDQGFKVGIYLSDIAGAFDRVDRSILTELLRRTGLSDALVDFLCDYLAPRFAVVIVQGHHSHTFTIKDEVFQGTVMGPGLWNIFFEPVDKPIRECNFKPAKFADDMTACRNFEGSTTNGRIQEELSRCQEKCHAWGSENRVTFDKSKEFFRILHRGDGMGEPFRLLGTIVDHKLTMESEIRRVYKKASPKLNAILATRHLYDLHGMFQQYKSHILCLLEQSAAAIYHAASTHLELLDRVQKRFLNSIGMSEESAFLDFNLAPLQLRRDIGVLGLLHKVQLGEAHPDFSLLFQKAVHTSTSRTRLDTRRHRKQFCEVFGCTDYFNRSVFAATRVYNVLPEYVINASSVTMFQSFLTKDARVACRSGSKRWHGMYNNRLR